MTGARHQILIGNNFWRYQKEFYGGGGKCRNSRFDYFRSNPALSSGVV